MTDRSDKAEKTRSELLLAEIPFLRAFAISLSGSVTAADDLVQDTLVKAWSTIDDRRKFILTWSEKDGPVVTPPVRTGFGSQLLNNILAQQLNGEVVSDYAPQGLNVLIKSDI